MNSYLEVWIHILKCELISWCVNSIQETRKCVFILPIVPSRLAGWTGKTLSAEGDKINLHFLSKLFFLFLSETITAQVCREFEKASFPWTSWWANIFQCILQILVKTLVKTCFGQIHMLVKTRVILFPPFSPPCNLLFNSLVTRCRVPGAGPFEMHCLANSLVSSRLSVSI